VAWRWALDGEGIDGHGSGAGRGVRLSRCLVYVTDLFFL